ncbi:MAG: response regulator [Bdellovibrionaceae bacterium]|nr:response regulator [Bdellovibrio sp.]
MEQVSVEPIKIFAHAISAMKGIPPEFILKNSPLPLLMSKKNNEWVSWSCLVEWMDWLDQSEFAPIDWLRVGEEGLKPKDVLIAQIIGRIAFSVRAGYWLTAKWFGPSQFRVITCQFEVIDENRIRETLIVPTSLAPCPQLFMVFKGTLAVFPKLVFGLPNSQVELQMKSHQAIYEIVMPTHQPFLRRLRMSFKSLLGLKSIFRELMQQQEAISSQSLKLVQERSEIRNTMANFPDGILIHRHGKIIFYNENMANFLNCKNLQVLIGKDILSMVSPDDLEKVKTRIAALRENPKLKNRAIEVTCKKFGTEEKAYGEVTSMTTLYEGEPAILVVTRDLSERKKYQTQLISNDRLASMGRLAAGVGHEINNPLYYVMLKLDAIREKLNDKVDQVTLRNFDEVNYGLTRIQSIVKDLKSLSCGPAEENVQEIDVATNLESAIMIASHEIQHRAELIVELQPLLKVMANDSQLGQVFLNLLINAAQSIEPGQTRLNKIFVKAYAQDRNVVIVIQDTGRGISEAVQQNIFEPFYTTKPVGQGTGLGLSISQTIINRFEGHISFESKPGIGTTFKVVLPAIINPTVQDDVPKNLYNKNQANSRISGHVVIIDDDVDLLETMKEIVSEEHKTNAFLNAADALFYLTENSNVDVIICDLMMPNMGGIEFYERLKVQAPQLLNRIIILTGGSFTAKTAHFLNQPDIRAFEKPLRKDELLNLINTHVVRSKQNQEAAGYSP